MDLCNPFTIAYLHSCFFRPATLIIMHIAHWLNACCLSLSSNCNKETSLTMLLELYYNPNNYFFVLQVNVLKSEIIARTHKYPYTGSKFSDFSFKRRLFIRVSIPSQPNKWTAFSDTKLIVRLALGSCAGQALLSQWKCNLCSANEEELPCYNSYAQHWKEMLHWQQLHFLEITK